MYPRLVEGPDGRPTAVRKGDGNFLALHPGEVKATETVSKLCQMLAMTPGDVLGDPCMGRGGVLFLVAQVTGCRGVGSELVQDRFEEAVQALQIAAKDAALTTLSSKITLYSGNMIRLANQGCYINVTHFHIADARIEDPIVKDFERLIVDICPNAKVVVKMKAIGCRREEKGASDPAT